ncbi:hypothetical protein Tco_1197354 [Tanacetum coccineum]
MEGGDVVDGNGGRRRLRTAGDVVDGTYLSEIRQKSVGKAQLSDGILPLIVVVLVGTLGPKFVLGFAPLESSLSQLVLVSASLGLHLVSAWVHVESAVVHLVSALIHLAIQTI